MTHIDADNRALIRWFQRQMNVRGHSPALKEDGWGPIGGKTYGALLGLLPPIDASAPPPESAISVGGLMLSITGIETLIGFEIGSDRYYEMVLSQPTWPGASSGVTIGIGYDLGYNSAETFEEDWAGRMDPDDGSRLEEACGLKGSTAKSWLSRRPDVRQIHVSLLMAKEVFYSVTLPKFAALTKDTFPGAELLAPTAQAMMVSLVYNRGGALYGDTRREMLAIHERLKRVRAAGAVTPADLTYIAGQIRSMKRLWNATTLAGLHRRRDRESELVLG